MKLKRRLARAGLAVLVAVLGVAGFVLAVTFISILAG
jgi:hypothetical protein